MNSPEQLDISHLIWQTKYRQAESDEQSVEASWRRIATALAAAEGSDADAWAERFYGFLEGFRFLPGGRIQAGAGSPNQVTLFNCFVMGTIPDSLEGICDSLKEGALTMQQGGGVGYDFSPLRPRGTVTRGAGTIASGPVSFMDVWNAMCATLLSTGARRGAMMATLRCDHPDILEFIDAKTEPGRLQHFNLSVLVTDDLMQAVREDAPWPLVFPADQLGPGESVQTVEREWPGRGSIPCRVLRTLSARELWNHIVGATYQHAEPGVLFVDRINRDNNLYWREHIAATNPCGEIPLPPYGACNLGSLNLVRYVREPFTPMAELDYDTLATDCALAVRMLDNVTDVSGFPLPAQAQQARGSRRIGLGVTGLADALMMLGEYYDSDQARQSAADIMRILRDSAYRASVQLAREKGPFPHFDRAAYLQAPFVQGLPEDIREAIEEHGIRNSHLLAIAPTGTISLLAGNVSSGIEPVFADHQVRKVLLPDSGNRSLTLEDYACRLWRQAPRRCAVPPAYADALSLEPRAHLAMQAALQPYVDNAISKTINIPADYPFEAFREVYERAWRMGLKGCTTYRPNDVTGSVLESGSASHCCDAEREGD
ncbi:MAG: adenosylcobalamin-dependent ribonucleoside-diphosphate reductase [Chromatiales bacterium]|nr:adenosylcobalamin-dependent ribonucleoside-diphosphate reductase [Chromatiales bacterium]